MKLNKKFYLFVLIFGLFSNFVLNSAGVDLKPVLTIFRQESLDFVQLKSNLLKLNKVIEAELIKEIAVFFSLEESINDELSLENSLNGRAKAFLDSRFFKRIIIKSDYLKNRQEIIQLRDFLAEILTEFNFVKRLIEQSNNLDSLKENFTKLVFVTEKLFIKVQLSQEKFPRRAFDRKSGLEDLNIVISQQEKAFLSLDGALKNCITYKEPSFFLRNSMKLYLTGVISLATLFTLICIGHNGRTNLWDCIKNINYNIGFFFFNGCNATLKTLGLKSAEQNMFAEDKLVLAQSCREQGRQLLDLLPNCPYNSRNRYDIRDAKMWIESEKMRVTDSTHDIYEREQFQQVIARFRVLHAEFGTRKDEFIRAADEAINFDLTQHVATMAKPYLVDDPACQGWFSGLGIVSRLVGKFLRDHSAAPGVNTFRPITALENKSRDFAANILEQTDILTGKVSDRVVRYANLWLAGLLLDVADFWQVVAAGAVKVDSAVNAIKTTAFLSVFAGMIFASYKICEKNKSAKVQEINLLVRKISLLLNKAKIDNSVRLLSTKDEGYLSYFISSIEKNIFSLNTQEQKNIKLLLVALKDEALNLSQKLRACELKF